MKNKALLAVLAAAALGGAVPVLIKVVVHSVPPMSLVFLRFLFGFLIFIPFILGKKFERKHLKKALLITMLSVANIIFFVFGIRETTPTISQTMYAGTPVIVALFSYYFLKERFSPKKIVGILIGLIGVLFIVLIPSLNRLDFKGVTLFGNLLVLAGVICYSSYFVFSKPMMKHYTPMQMTFLFVTVTLFLSTFGLSTEATTYGAWWQALTLGNVLALIYLGTIGTSFVYFLFQYATNYGTPVISSLSMYLAPVSTYIWAYVLLGEKLTPEILGGVVLVFAGAWLVSSA
ncbi:hypothetical protein A3F34_01165 [Candidatus Roizmanbacteria bacterium RIFCSPHIGHO2_12_FULL_44_10]|uniref:EamA domain-containing protein n=1 Tax=Candidatus Roizmanbacteria bacterium RIFCSPHIGHO2_12_FULL_44_10 TaxID=1802054 RepID=A0A1F7I666_9BACT|nr:MAG: hypothetical protein A3F34_01165 [Candidatus Roizmanbacteria bacterium RIFCSPHIGHO2_12_FULL_44_10]